METVILGDPNSGKKPAVYKMIEYIGGSSTVTKVYKVYQSDNVGSGEEEHDRRRAIAYKDGQMNDSLF